MFLKKRAMLATAAVASIVTLAGCSGGSSESDPTDGGNGGGAATGGTLTLGLIAQASSFSAQGANWANEAPYIQAVYDTLLRAEPDGSIGPNLATEWSWSDDLLTLTMTLRDDVTFTDGSALTADVAAQNLIRFRDGTSPNASALVNIEDATALDDTTLQITLKAPDPALETFLTQNGGAVESAEAFDSPDIETIPVGSGPYIYNASETVVGTSYVFDRNPDYWQPEDQHYDKLILNVYTDPTAIVNAVQGGQLDATMTLDAATVDAMTSTGYQISTIEQEWTGLILADRGGELEPALADTKVRQAIAHAFDREAFLAAVGSGRGTVTGQIFPPSSPSYNPSLDDRFPYDPDMAKQLLAEAGYGDGLTMTMPSTAAVPSAWFTLIQQQLADVGITVVYDDVAPADFIGDMLSPTWSSTWMQLQQDPTDWQLISFQVTAASLFNLFHYEDATVEDLAASIQYGDEAAGAELNEYIVEQAWFVPFYRRETTFVHKPEVAVEMQVGNTYPYLWNIKPAA